MHFLLETKSYLFQLVLSLITNFHHTMNAQTTLRLVRETGSLLILSLTALSYAEEKASEKKSDIEVTVSETAAKDIDQIGKSTFDSQDLSRQLGSTGDLNQVSRSLPGIQFDNAAGELSEDSILDLRPSRLSISGGRVYDNSFQLEGLSTNSVQNTTNTNMHDAIEVVVHPQTSFINPSLVDSVVIYTSDIPVEFGGFTGGVVSAKLRDPSYRLGAGATYSYTSDSWVNYLIAPENRSAVLPEKPRFERHSGDVYVDLPLGKSAGLLLSYAKNRSVLENTQRQSLFGVFSTRSTTTSENYTAKLAWKLSPDTTFRYTSLWSPYRQQNYEQSPKFQNNNGWVNKVEITRKTTDSTLEVFTGYSWSNTDRDQEANIYTYKNIGSINWVSSTAASASKGGFGDIVSRQLDLPTGVKFEKSITQTGKLALGADYQFTNARRQRPETNSAYRHQSSASVKLDPRITSADGAGDQTVIEGEQALNYRIVYRAFDAKANLNATDAWVQWSDKGAVGKLPWSYRAGLRADTNDFLRNTDLSPRVTGQFSPFKWLKLNAGFNRYYTRALLAYKLRESYPGNYIYTRTGKLTNGKLVFSNADWTLYSMSKSTGYGDSDLKTPSSDELSFGAKIDLGQLGDLDITRLRRRAKDEFSRDSGTKVPYTKDDGSTDTYTLYRVINGGYTDYDATTVSWTRKWKGQRLQANATFSNTRTSTVSGENDPDYFDSYNEVRMQESVYYNGAVVPRRQVALVRDNYARPLAINFLWSADWLKNRLRTDLVGRWNERFERIEQNGTTVVSGTKYDLYEDVRVPSSLIADLNVTWAAWQGKRLGSVELTLKISNVLNRLPHSEAATITDPYEQGRAFWASAKYSF